MEVWAGAIAGLEGNKNVHSLLDELNIVRPTSFHPLFGNHPHTGFEIDLIPLDLGELTLSHHRQQHELDCEA